MTDAREVKLAYFFKIHQSVMDAEKNMKRLAITLVISLLVAQGTSFAVTNDTGLLHIQDHRGGGDIVSATRLAYQLANIGEAWANRSYDYQLQRAASDLHHAASDLYYALRNWNGGMRVLDHNGGGGNLDYLVDRVGNAVEYFASRAPWDVALHVRYIFGEIRDSI